MSAALMAACTTNAGPDEVNRSTTTPASNADGKIGTGAGAPDPDPTPLPVDEAIRIGHLDNGLTYYLRSNDSPGGSLALRLVVKAGGLQEDPRGVGVAHFLEHMMFNGTERFPGNELEATLRSIGAEIGPDFNAYTSDSETVYQITVADVASNVELALDVLAQWASAATLDPVEVQAEAGVVREEERSRRQSGPGLIQSAFDRAYYAGTPWEGVNVVGTEQSINSITPEVLRAFYDTWYRPDNMAVVVVGDRSVDQLKQEIVERFDSLQSRGPGTQFLLAAVAPRAEPLVDVVVEPSFADSFVSLDYPVPSWNLGTHDGNKLAAIESVAGLMLNERLTDGIDSERLPLRSAVAVPFWQTRGLRFVGFNADADNLLIATEALTTEIERSIAGGFEQAELDRAIDTLRSSQDQRLAEAGSVQDELLADEMVAHFMGGADLQSIEDSVAMNQAILDELTVEKIQSHWRWAMAWAGPTLLAVGPTAEQTGEPEAHRSALQRARAAAAAATTGEPDDDVVVIEALMSAPEPVAEVERTPLTHNPGFELRFANGARVLFSPSDIASAQVTVTSRSPGGRAQLAPEDGPIAPIAVGVVASSGLGPYDPVQVRRYLRDANLSFGPYLDDDAEGFSGGAAPEDLETLFQLLHLWVTEPRADVVPLRQQVAEAKDQLTRAGLDPALAAEVAVQDARNRGAHLTALPTGQQLDRLNQAEAERIFVDRFAQLDDHVVLIVGDVEAERVVDLARRYIGTLPGGTPEPDTAVALVSPVERRLSIGSGQASGSYRLLIQGQADETIANRVLADLATSLLNDRLFTVVREQLSATYGGSAAISFEEPGNGAELRVSVDGDPRRLDEIAAAVETEIEALSAGRVTATDFAEATAVLHSRYNFIDHGFILQSLLDEALQPASRVITSEAQILALGELSASDLATFMRGLVSDTNRIDVRALPGG